MAKQTINIGASPNDGTGTPLRTAFDYCNLNFTELYTAVGPSGNNIVVPGTATITGDLTVDTSTLKVDSANNRVGINTASPAYNLDVIGSASIGGTGSAFTRFTSNGGITTLGVGAYVSVQGSGNPATGSGIEINGGATPFILAYNRDGSAYLPLTIDGSSVLFKTSGSEKARIDSSGNVGIGVTPSAWNSNYNGLDIGQNGCIAGRVGSSNTIDIISNGFRNSAGNYVYKLATSNTACRYQLDGSTGSHIWYSGAAGTAGNTIAGFSTALMTLDASGNLILQSPSSPPTLATNGQLTVNATSNTNLRFSYRGSDGVTRTANITLA